MRAVVTTAWSPRTSLYFLRAVLRAPKLSSGGASATRPNYLIVFSRLEHLLVLNLEMVKHLRLNPLGTLLKEFGYLKNDRV